MGICVVMDNNEGQCVQFERRQGGKLPAILRPFRDNWHNSK